MTLDEAAEVLARHPHHPTVTAHTLFQRRRRKWTLERALQTPMNAKRRKRWPHIGLAIEQYLARQPDGKDT